MNDVTLKTADDKVVYLARHDRAEPRKTGISAPTTTHSTSTLHEALRVVCEVAGAAALLLLRIRRYQEVVESFGDSCGQNLDREIRDRLRTCLRDSDWILPMGKGEYAVIIPEPQGQAELDLVCERLVQAAGGTYDFGGATPRIQAAIGVAFHPADSRKVEDVVRFASVALRGAEADAERTHCCFSHDMLKRQRYRLWMEGELRRALAEDRFVLHYQPQFTLNGHEIIGVEALVRMVTAEGEFVQPNDFISVAEETDVIVELGHWVIREACRQLAQWQREIDTSPRRVAVNVSSRQLQDRRLPSVIKQAIEEAGIPPESLELEITESCMLELRPVTGDVLRQLRDLGVRIAIDDFGAGFSCFANLARLPLDTFKLDRSFMTDIASDARARQVVTAMIAMARELGYHIVAEGVETEQQYWFLQASGCHLVQGFGLARPQDAAAIRKLLSGGTATEKIRSV